MKSFIKKYILIIWLILPIISQSQIKSTDLEYLRIAEIEYSNDSLFLLQEIRPLLGRMDTTRGNIHKLALSNKEKTKFLKYIEKINLLKIQSNTKQKNGYFPFEITYKIDGKDYFISSYQSGMSESESKSFEKYLAEIGFIINFKQAKEKFLMTMVDGQYQLRTNRRYQKRIGPSGWDSWEKKNGELQRLGMHLVIMDGKEVDPNLIANINPKKIKSFKILKNHDADSLYGEKGKNGVVIIKTK